ncbi:Protein phosphatase 2C (PP2C) [Durusdinium trenchii]|uniref:Protein phosphatase 2C (PP2C) n=1 Tax=Durusdinium trenchii TaxID=1381693 RepID=A0ABP0MUR2_9DINO
MGQGLPKAVTSVAVKRVGGTAFRVGFAEMNGWRPSMEDAHVIYAQDTWGFFGVFDGHGGDQCSGFIARRIHEELAQSGMPDDDEAVIALALRLDKEFLDSNQPSGSTGTFVIVKAPTTPGGNYHLRVGNIGDSRVLLGRADGSIYPGPGTDSGLTTDHKPDLPSERQRIERTGGNVQEVMGVARVNGDLAVSRAFGDAQHKTTGGPKPEDHPVCAAPELMEFECGPTDFLMLVCDGISEGSFPNEAVVRLAAEKLKAEGPVDPAQAAIAVCHEAIKCGSKDNLSCMVVLLGGGEVPGEGVEFVPGPFEAPENAAFRKAYAAMAEHAGMSLPQALEKQGAYFR